MERMIMMPIYFYETDIGKIAIAEKDGNITNLYFTSDKLPYDMQVYETPLLKEAAQQLTSYLAGNLREFSLTIAPAGTDFMKQVWASLCEIPYGKTSSYKDIAVKIGNPGAARAVGLANNRNPIPIFIPCHRVIGGNGSLTGYRGGIDLKRKLLEIENYEPETTFRLKIY
jgi:methylated-DNA-[protein]-cysteine S-methyltransferase